jgi:hypothetical protein
LKGVLRRRDGSNREGKAGLMESLEETAKLLPSVSVARSKTPKKKPFLDAQQNWREGKPQFSGDFSTP